MTSCEAAIWEIAAWLMESADGEKMTETINAAGLNRDQQEAMRDHYAHRIMEENLHDERLQAALSCLGTHPGSRVSGIRSAFDCLQRAYTKCSSIYPDNWFNQYREFMIEREIPLPDVPQSMQPLFLPPRLNKDYGGVEATA